MSRSAKQRRKARKAREAQRAAEKGQVFAPNRRNVEALGMILGRCGRGGSHGDARKERSRKACRGNARED